MPWKNPWYDPQLAHHLPNGFCNIEPGRRQPGDLKRWRRMRREQGLPFPPDDGYPGFIARWWQYADICGNEDAVWWLGHATLLLRINGRYLLTDPVFSHRASPLRFWGPQRRTPLALVPDDLPQLDAVLISHNHYDHLDGASIRLLHRRFPHVAFLVPAGLGAWFRRRGIHQVVERDWWQNHELNGITLTAVPARHWSMRTPWDRNRSLWCGWVVEGASRRFWFSGDTGYSDLLLEIPRRLGALDGAAIPIGAYEPRWFMRDHHMGPQEAVELWRAIGRPLAIPIHWGVFELADESLDAPPRELRAALSAAGEQESTFRPLRIGQYLAMARE
jgi:L-ascorbate metabolism protein UlaG (beta-lactamase superfamily)